VNKVDTLAGHFLAGRPSANPCAPMNYGVACEQKATTGNCQPAPALREMVPETVGDYLGHRDPMTTQRYTKIALEQLRGVATGDGEDVL
jgi:hypothetical protein